MGSVLTDRMGESRLLKFEALSAIYTPEVQVALRRYKEHLEDTRMRLRQREKEAVETLERYGMAGRGMDEIGGRYRSLLKEVESAKADIRRLRGEV